MKLAAADVTVAESGAGDERAHLARRRDLELTHARRIQRLPHRFFHVDSPLSIHGLLRTALRACGLQHRGRRNARRLTLARQAFELPHLPRAFDGFRILHLSDLHLDMDRACTEALVARVGDVDHDVCVLTGDYRAETYGDNGPAMEALAALRKVLRGPVYAVLGNHDSADMVPALWQLDIQVLLNRGLRLERQGHSIGLAGVDDPHWFKLHDLSEAGASIWNEPVKVLLCHSPELYREAANAGFHVFLCGHTHGGQICLPGGTPLTLECPCPRALGRGYWQHGGLQGYTSAGSGTSMVNVRLNCPPEISLHVLRTAQ